ncbi:MAG: PD-(D/E)XK nuclease family protein [Muribaculaceae bacterium]|nr:PD-(D/E)XK nuclease family protein [Muribaculaceae bacterium]
MKNQNDYQYLKESPMFHFSLHAKELFHSNFLAWLGMDPDLRGVFINVLTAGLGIDEDTVKSWGTEFEVLREKDNLDLVVKAQDHVEKSKRRNANDRIVSGQWYVVIENKIKSVPNKAQLDKYADDINNKCGGDPIKVEKFLLTICESDIELTSGWRLVTYSKIAEALKKSINHVKDPYKKYIISDYVRMVEALIDILNNEEVNMTCPFLFRPSRMLDELRIADLVDKRRAARIAEIYTKNTGLNYGSGYTNKQSLIETVKRYGDISVGIQIQGSQYRHFIMGYIKENEVADRSNGFLSNTRKEFRDKILMLYPDVFESSSVRGENNRPFNSYDKNKEGETFWYQYVTIRPDATIKQIMDCISEDMKTADIIFATPSHKESN